MGLLHNDGIIIIRWANFDVKVTPISDWWHLKNVAGLIKIAPSYFRGTQGAQDLPFCVAMTPA